MDCCLNCLDIVLQEVTVFYRLMRQIISNDTVAHLIASLSLTGIFIHHVYSSCPIWMHASRFEDTSGESFLHVFDIFCSTQYSIQSKSGQVKKIIRL